MSHIGKFLVIKGTLLLQCFLQHWFQVYESLSCCLSMEFFIIPSNLNINRVLISEVFISLKFGLYHSIFSWIIEFIWQICIYSELCFLCKFFLWYCHFLNFTTSFEFYHLYYNMSWSFPNWIYFHWKSLGFLDLHTHNLQVWEFFINDFFSYCFFITFAFLFFRNTGDS